MKRTNRLLSLLLTVLLLIGALTACGGASSAPSTGEATGSVDSPLQTTAATTGMNAVGDPEHHHEWSDWTTALEPTCSEEGISSRSCSCGAVENKSIDKLDHTEGEWVVITKPTEDVAGKKALLCSVCGEQMDEELFTRSAEWTYLTDKLGYCSGYSSVNGSYRDVILDSYGEIVYATQDGEEIEVYANGYFISEADGVQYLKKADGTVVCSTQSLEITGFGLTANYTDYKQFLGDGYVFAYNIIETFADSTFQIGILDTNGDWIVPLSEDHPILAAGAQYSEAIFNKHSYEYAGEGILFVNAKLSDYSYDYLLYDIDSNEIHRLTPNVSSSNIDYMATEAVFENGVFYGTYSKKMFRFSTDGSVTITDAFPSDASKSGFGIIVESDGTYYTVNDKGIYRNGVLHKSLDFTVTGAASVGDVWLIFIKNPTGSYYYTYLTTDGDFLFDPVATTATYICDLSGVGVSYSSSYVQDDGVKLVIDVSGTVHYTSTQSKAYIYLNKGVVCEQIKGAFSTTETYTFLP